MTVLSNYEFSRVFVIIMSNTYYVQFISLLIVTNLIKFKKLKIKIYKHKSNIRIIADYLWITIVLIYFFLLLSALKKKTRCRNNREPQ